MTDDSMFNRRRVLELTGIGTGVAVSGCITQSGNGGDGAGETREAAILIRIDRQALRQRQQELEPDEDENMSEEDIRAAQEEIQTLQQDLVDEAIENAETEFEELDVSIEDQIPSQQLLLISGPAGSLLDTLELDIVEIMAARSAYEQVQSAQEQQQQEQQSAETSESTDE